MRPHLRPHLRIFAIAVLGMVAPFLLGLGAVPATHPLSLGMMGMHGTYEANMAVHYSDLVIAVGSRFDDRVTGKVSEFCPHAKVIHIDIDPTSIRKNIHVDVPIVGNIPDVLEDFLKLLKGAKLQDLKAWWKQIDEWRGKDCLRYDRDSEKIKPQYVVEQIHKVTCGKAKRVISGDFASAPRSSLSLATLIDDESFRLAVRQTTVA